MHHATASEFLQHLRITALECALIEVEAGGGAIFVAQKPSFHLLLTGACTLVADDQQPWLTLRPGDFLVLPHGERHSLCDGADVLALPAARAQRTPSPLARDVPVQLAVGEPGDQPAFHVLSGVFDFPIQTTRPIVSALPRVLRLPAQPGLHQSVAERATAPGGRAFVERLANLLLLETVRAEPGVMSRLSTLGASWLRTFGVEHAIAAISANPAHAWSLAGLAQHAGMSRASFAAKYQAHVGQPPMQHVAAIRLAHAANLLRSTAMPLSEVAAQSGYRSESSFGRAFARQYGAAPAAYRKQAWVQPLR